MGELTVKKNEMMDDDAKLAVEFNQLFGEFCELNISVKGLFQQIMLEEDMNNDQQHWFEAKTNSFREFTEFRNWIKYVHRSMEEAKKVNEYVIPSIRYIKYSMYGQTG